MRLFENLIFLTGILSLILPLYKNLKDKKIAIYMPDITLLFTILHLIFEGYRAPMLPIYIIITGVFISNYIKPQFLLQRKWLLTTVNITVILALCFVSLIPNFLPVPSLPKPTGKYSVGTSSYKWTDLERKDTLSPDKSAPREIMVQFWYPAKPAPNASKSLYAPDIKMSVKALNKEKHGLDALITEFLNYIFLDQFFSFRNNSYTQAPISNDEESYPIVFFSHGIAGIRSQNTYQCEELASNGYIVVSIDHTYESYLTVFPDGKIIPSSAASFISDTFSNGVEAMDSTANRQFMDIRKADILFVLKEIEKQNSNNSRKLLDGRTDLSKVGAIGFSCGGSLAADLVMSEKQFKAGISLDGLLFKDIYAQTEKNTENFGKSFLFFISDTYNPNNPKLKQYKYIEAAINEYHSRIDKMRSKLSSGYKVSIAQTGHFNFCEYSLFMPTLQKNDLAGTIDPLKCLKSVASYDVAFFDKHLKNKAITLFDTPPTEYPEISYQK